MQDVLITFVLTVAAGAVTAFLSVQFALRRFRAERWWERKAQAYAELFSALFHVQRFCRVKLRNLEEGVPYSENYMEELNTKANAGFAEIRRAAKACPASC